MVSTQFVRRATPIGRGMRVVRMTDATRTPRLHSMADTDCMFPF